MFSCRRVGSLDFMVALSLEDFVLEESYGDVSTYNHYCR